MFTNLHNPKKKRKTPAFSEYKYLPPKKAHVLVFGYFFPKISTCACFFLEIFWEYLTQTSFESLALGRKKALKASFFVVAWNSRISISFANKTMLNRNYSAKHHVFSVYNSEPLYKTWVFFSENKHVSLFSSQIFLKKCRFPKINTGVYIFGKPR